MSMMQRLDPLDRRLLDEFQRDLPLVSRPFAAMADALGACEDEVIARLSALQEAGLVTRVGATVRPNTAGASTLAAIAVPEHRIEEVAAIVGDEPGVNHSYLREDEWNLWFVATAPTAAALAESLERIARRSGLRVLDLPLLRPFNIDLGFRLTGPRQTLRSGAAPDPTAILPGDRPILQAMAEGLALTPTPFAHLAARLGSSEGHVIDRLARLSASGILTRIGVIVRHRAIGWRSNAMVVWDLPQDRIETAGLALAGLPGVTLCYQRRTVPGIWPFGLFSMIHARSRAEALDILGSAAALPELAGANHRTMFSTRCFKQTGALVHREEAAA
jgi:DNA-binding Lrp family transcriptional regulator